MALLDHCVVNEENLADLTTQVKQLENDNKYLFGKVEDLENHRRFASLHFLRIPGDTEGCDILGFTVDLIPQLLGIDKFPIPLSVESAHHTPVPKVHSNVRPSSRPILIKLVHFQDKWLWLGFPFLE